MPTPREAQPWYASRADRRRRCTRVAQEMWLTSLLLRYWLCRSASLLCAWVNAVLSFTRFVIGLQVVADGGARCKSAAILRALFFELLPSSYRVAISNRCSRNSENCTAFEIATVIVPRLVVMQGRSG